MSECLNKDRVFSKKSLKLLVEEIRYQNSQLVMIGSNTALARILGESKKGTPQGEVPFFGFDWLPELYALRTIRFELPRTSV